MLSLSLATALVAAPVAGAIAHELTHSFVAESFGAETVIDVWGLECRYDASELTRAQERMVNLAPATVGWTAGALGWFTIGVPSFKTWWTLVPLLFWATFTLLAGPADYSLTVSRGDEWFWSRWDAGQKRMAGALVCQTFGVVWLWSAPYLGFGYAPQRLGQAIGQAGMFSALVLVIWALVHWERNGSPAAGAA
jgi:hypothetical protein